MNCILKTEALHIHSLEQLKLRIKNTIFGDPDIKNST